MYRDALQQAACCLGYNARRRKSSIFLVMPIALAPMEGLVDAPLRDLITRMGGVDWCVTEFLRVTGSLLPAAAFRRIAPEHAHGWRI